MTETDTEVDERASLIARLRSSPTQASVRRVHVASPGGHRLRLAATVTTLTVVLIAVTGFALSIGSVHIPLADVWGVIGHRIFPPGLITPTWNAVTDRIVADVRLPRVLLAAIAGMSLTVVGTVVQAVMRNPLAGPTVLGVSAGAATGAVFVMRFGLLVLGAYTLNIAAFLGALLTLLLVLSIAKYGGRISATTLVLTGMAISAVLSAITSFLVLTADDRTLASQVLFWTLGGFGSAQWKLIPIPAIVLVLGVSYALAQARNLNLLLTGEESAISMGLDVHRFRQRMFVLSAAMIGVTVAVCGVIGFVGLVMPHITRLLVGANHRRCLPVGMLLGAIFTIGADLLARTVISPEELPVGIITALVGGPFFLYLLRRTSKGPGR
ncbi:iron complex transport system permease protein [Antricoccus suffuscus]|uniref:Iron complex transport system permease protein n=1 Tax=Antricoccus suffuscus TaxID=1629062 RepID=A0A2T1A6P2_9ACTN|nr:iron ABC transporter permease [Antricoccus suffuscus]PRZ44147.1 iron complex transport system permease protein [Antricoccus suffuscus]